MHPLLVLVLAQNVLTFLLLGWDKGAANRGARRVSERRLLLFAALMGAPGAWLGVRIFRHKTRKRTFRSRLVLVTIGNVLVLALLAYWAVRSG